jgi:uncharacterized protein (PEP-CTERM system associated)
VALGLAALTAAGSARAQDAAGRPLAVTTTFDATLSYLRTTPQGGGGVTDGVLQLRPGVQLSSRSGRVRGTLNYSLDAIQHTDRAQGSALQNYLNAAFTAEAVPNWAFVDAAASISQRTLSAYGQQSVDGVQANGNRTEVASVSLSPYVKGLLAGLATYEARVNGSATSTRDAATGDSTSSGGSVSLGSYTRSTIGWSLSASRQRTGYRQGRASTGDAVSASLIGRPDPDLTLTLRGGQESNDIVGLARTTYGNYGAQAVWTPTVRTTVDLGADHRYFGDSHRVLIEHRFARSSFRFSSSRDSSSPILNSESTSQIVTYYQLLDLIYTSAVPDPIARDQRIRGELRAAGIDPNAVAVGGPVNSAASLLNRQDLGWTYSGLRTTFSLLAFTSSSSVIDTASTVSGDANYRQRGYTLTVSHRLTPTASTSVSGSDLKTLSNGARAGSDLRSLSLNVTEQISRRVSASLAARHTVLSGSTNPYHESSLSASVGVRF